MSAPAPFNSQVLGRAHYAARAVLERELERRGMTFHQSLALNVVAAAGGSIDRAELADRLGASAKIDAATVDATVAALAAAGLLRAAPDAPDRLVTTDAGRAEQHAIAAWTAPVAARLYGGIPTEDMAVAGRVLALVTERANAELAASAAGVAGSAAGAPTGASGA
ncbi:MarR family transcriptional regulator [Streptomyces sp. NPDC003327]